MELVNGAVYRSRSGALCRVEGRLSFGLFMIRQIDTWHTYYVTPDGKFSQNAESLIDLVECLSPTGKLMQFPTDRQPKKFNDYWPTFIKRKKKEMARMERAMDNLAIIKRAKQWGDL